MALHFEILVGPKPGKRFPITGGTTIGRKNCPIILNDPKVSGLHAMVERRGESFFLKDNRSANGLKVDGQRVSELKLEIGSTVTVGRCVLRVVEVDAAVAPEAPALTWNQKLAKKLLELSKSVSSQPQPVAALDPLLRLRFCSGLQNGTEWVLGYGPRQVGRGTPDLRLLDSDAPELCFEILPSPQGPQFKTSHPEQVRLNGKALSTGYLRHGDQIEVLDNLIEVDLESDR